MVTWGKTKKNQAYMKDKPKGMSGAKLDTNPTGDVHLKESVRKTLPEPYSDKWNELKRHVENQFDRTFNSVKLENLQSVYPEYYENIEQKEITKADLKDYFGESLEGKTEDEIEDAKQELQDEQGEIIWGTLFEAADDHVASKIKDNMKEIQNLGLSVIDISNTDAVNNYQTGVFLGVRSAGHDFYESYWVPLWKIFGWLPE